MIILKKTAITKAGNKITTPPITMRIDLYVVYRNGKRYDRLKRFLKYCKKKGIKK